MLSALEVSVVERWAFSASSLPVFFQELCSAVSENYLIADAVRNQRAEVRGSTFAQEPRVGVQRSVTGQVCRGELGVPLLIRGIRAVRGFPVVVSKIDEAHPKCHCVFFSFF
jgi:hypothetical protein